MLEISSFVLTFIFGVTSLYFGLKSRYQDREKRRFHWGDIHLCANSLARKIKKESFMPDVIFTPGLNGATFANLISNQFDGNIPVFVGLTFEKSCNVSVMLNDYIAISTSKWNVYMPKSVLTEIDQENFKVLIVDDFVMSGDFIEKFTTYLTDSCKINRKNIKSLTIGTSHTAIATAKGADYYWKEVTDSKSLFFPWGKTESK